MTEADMKNKSSYIGPVIYIAALAFIFRVVHVISISEFDPAFTHPLMDARWHVEWARGVALGLWKPEPFFRAPLYPFFLGVLFKVFGFSLFAPRVVQALIGAANCVLIWRLGVKLAGPVTGMVSGVISAVYGPFIYFDATFLIPNILLPLTVASLLLLIGAAESSREGKAAFWKWALAGLVAGIAAIARPNIIAFVPGVFVWIYFEFSDWRKRALIFACWLILFLVPVGGITVFNAVEGGGFVPVAGQGGINFWIGNNRDADGRTAMAPAYQSSIPLDLSQYRDNVAATAEMEAERRLGRQLKAADVSNYWFGQAWKYISEHPGAWIGLMARKAYYLINGYEFPSNRDIYDARRWSPLLRYLIWKKPLAFPFGLLLPLALAGMVFAWRKPGVDASVNRLLLLYSLIYSATVVAFFVTARHRLPIVPALIPYAAHLLAALPRGYKNTTNLRMERPGVACIAMIVYIIILFLSNMNYFDARDVPMREHHMNMGHIFTAEKRYDEAIESYKAALEEEPNLDRAQFSIASIYMMMGKPDKAMKAAIEVLEINPRYSRAYMLIGNIQLQAGNYTGAKDAYSKAIQLNPGDAVAHYNLALLYSRLGDLEAYVRELRATLDADPSFVPANLGYAALLIGEGRNEEARAYIDRVIKIDPNNRQAMELLQKLK